MFGVERALLPHQEEILGEVPETLKNRGSLKANSSRSTQQNDSQSWENCEQMEDTEWV